MSFCQVMPFQRFKALLDSGTKLEPGFIAILAEYIKQKAALELGVLQKYEAINTIDCDSVWLRRAMPPKMFCGHAAGTLAVNPVSHENKDKAERLMKLSAKYCSYPRDFRKPATPLRWPTGSPALQSLVVKLRPMFERDTWNDPCSGQDFEVVMNAIWNVYNNWGLRAGFNAPSVRTIVPYYAWGQPTQQHSV